MPRKWRQPVQQPVRFTQSWGLPLVTTALPMRFRQAWTAVPGRYPCVPGTWNLACVGWRVCQAHAGHAVTIWPAHIDGHRMLLWLQDLVDGLVQLGVDAKCTLGTGCPPVEVKAAGLPSGKVSHFSRSCGHDVFVGCHSLACWRALGVVWCVRLCATGQHNHGMRVSRRTPLMTDRVLQFGRACSWPSAVSPSEGSSIDFSCP